MTHKTCAPTEGSEESKEQMSRKLKKIWNFCTTLIVAVVVILALLLVGARVIGLQVFTVLSGSMEWFIRPL